MILSYPSIPFPIIIIIFFGKPWANISIKNSQVCYIRCSFLPFFILFFIINHKPLEWVLTTYMWTLWVLVIICPTLFRTSGLVFYIDSTISQGLGFHNVECDVKSIKCWIYIYIYIYIYTQTHFNALQICWNLEFFFFLKSSISRQENKKNWLNNWI